jgi:choline dehydrogenase-like flavoprotein
MCYGRQPEPGDYVIVNAGTAGCVLAKSPVRHPGRSALVLEAGGKDSWIRIHIPVGYLHPEPSAHRLVLQNRARARLNCRTSGEALQRHIQRLLLDAGGLGGEAQLLQRLDADNDLVRGLTDRIGCADRAIDQRCKPTDRCDPDQRAAQRANARAQQLRLAAEALQPA